MEGIYLPEEDFEELLKSFPARAVCDKCRGEMVFVVKKKKDRRVFFYLCQDPDCGHNTEPGLATVRRLGNG